MALALELKSGGIDAIYEPNGNFIWIPTPTVQSMIVSENGCDLRLTQFFCTPYQFRPSEFASLNIDLTEPDSIDKIIQRLQNPTPLHKCGDAVVVKPKSRMI